MEERVFVIGEVLLDMIGEFNPAQEKMANKTGTITLSVGGAAFNIAANLASRNIRTSLFSCLKRNAPTTYLIKSALKNSGISYRHVMEVRENTASEQAYVALFSDQKFISGVTSSIIESVDILSNKTLANGIKTASIIIADTNLTTAQIQGIAKLCKQYQKPLAISIVSDAKATRITRTHNFEDKFKFVSLNTLEAKALDFQRDDIYDKKKHPISAKS